MEGGFMSRISFATLLAGLAIVAFGCGKTSPPEEKAASKPKTSHFGHDQAGHTHDHTAGQTADDSLDEVKHSIELQAQRAKKDIDDVTAQAEEALQKSQNSLTTKAKAHARDLNEYSAELAEEAKDRAEDVPEAVDNAASRIKQRLKAAEQRLQEAQERLTEEESEDTSR
jgi:hypothetical protein